MPFLLFSSVSIASRAVNAFLMPLRRVAIKPTLKLDLLVKLDHDLAANLAPVPAGGCE